MDKDDISEESGFNYDYCIVRNNDDDDELDDSASDSISLLSLPNSTNIEASPKKDTTESKELDDAPESEEVDDSPESEEVDDSPESEEVDDSPELDLKDTFTLMLGLMVKLEKYFTRNANRSAEDADFKEKVLLVRECLIKTSKHVGYKITENNGSFLVRNDSTADNNKTDIKSTSTESPAQEKEVSENSEKKNSGKTPQKGTKRKSSTLADTKTRNLNPRSSKRSKSYSYVCCNERLINTAAKLRCSRTNEDFQSVMETLKDNALDQTKSKNRPSNKKLSKSFNLNKTRMNNRNLSRRSTSINGSLKRPLFEPVKWLETFNKTYAPPQ